MIFDQILYAGASWSFTKAFPDYPASEWNCDLTLKRDSDLPFTIIAEKDSDDFTFSATAVETSTMNPGYHKYQFKFTNTTTGAVEIKSGFETIVALLENISDVRSHNKKMLDALQATLEGRATKEILNMSYKGRAFQLLTIQELRDAIEYYKGEVAAEEREEKIKNDEDTGGRLLLGFN